MKTSTLLSMPQRNFSKVVAFDESDDMTNLPSISLEEFYSTVADFTITDEEALEYMNFSAKLAMVKFKDQEEMLSFKGDFQAALAFIQKLDEVDVKGTNPLGNVLEFYGGNDSKMRNKMDFLREDDDQTRNLDFKTELKKLNKHVVGNYVVLNRTKRPDLDKD